MAGLDGLQSVNDLLVFPELKVTVRRQELGLQTGWVSLLNLLKQSHCVLDVPALVVGQSQIERDFWPARSQLQRLLITNDGLLVTPQTSISGSQIGQNRVTRIRLD